MKKRTFTNVIIFIVIATLFFSSTSLVFAFKKLIPDNIDDDIVDDDIIINPDALSYAKGDIRAGYMLQGSYKAVFICEGLKPNTYYDMCWSLDTDYNSDSLSIQSYTDPLGQNYCFFRYSDDSTDGYLMKTFKDEKLLFENKMRFRTNADGRFIVIFGNLKTDIVDIFTATKDFAGLINYIEIEEVA